MAEPLKLLASLSLSGSLVILTLLLCRPFLKNRLSKRWQYYIWLAAVLRLLLPLSPEASPVGALFQEPADGIQTAAFSAPSDAGAVPDTAGPSASAGNGPSPAAPDAAERPALSHILFPLWLAGALALLAWKAAAYRSFLRHIRAGSRAVSDPVLLDRLAQAGARAGVRRPVELYEAPLAASPMLLGLFRPRIVLPSLSEEDFQYAVLHELVHCRRRDLAYKWLVQLAVCLHWFNPLAWLLEREISRTCELACDEAVLQILDAGERRAYGETLLRALEFGGPCHASPGATALGADAKLLKERLGAIMNFKKTSKWTALLSLVLTAALTAGSAAAGAYTGPAKQASPYYVSGTAASAADLPARKEESRPQAVSAVEDCYEEGDIAGFSLLLPFLGKEEQTAWLERCYTDGQISFFNVCLSELEEEAPSLVEACAQRAYEDGRLSFFSVASQYMDDETLNDWIDRVSGDRGQAALLAALLGAAGRDGEKDALEKQLAEEYEAKRLAEYRAHGVTKDGKNYYYGGKLIRVFLDQQPNSAFYTLDIRPSGEVDVRIIRDAEGRITGAALMTKTEAEALFGDWSEPDEPEDLPDGAA